MRSAPGGLLPVLIAAMMTFIAANLPACVANSTGTDDAGAERRNPPLSAQAALGKQMFNDVGLSASGRQSCATCHLREYAYAGGPEPSVPGNRLPVPLGGPGVDQAGYRTTPSLMYSSYAPPFHYDYRGVPNGGLFWDGRAATLEDQAMAPLLNPVEMANADAAALVVRLRTRPYAQAFEAVHGSRMDENPEVTAKYVGEDIAAYERESAEFHPFTSKYDYWQKGQTSLTAQERRGYMLFTYPKKGNCAACHRATSADRHTPALFTDFGYDNLGLPRNPAIPANGNRMEDYDDLGICGPLRTGADRDLSRFCGRFKVPTLRNVAVTAPYYHNGLFRTLRDAVAFYFRRDTDPEEWYPTDGDGTVTMFDDLPARYGGQFKVRAHVPGSDQPYAGNVNRIEVPYDRRIGKPPALSAQDIDDIVAFLCTLTDGFDPGAPSSYRLPAQCTQAGSAAP